MTQGVVSFIETKTRKLMSEAMVAHTKEANTAEIYEPRRGVINPKQALPGAKQPLAKVNRMVDAAFDIEDPEDRGIIFYHAGQKTFIRDFEAKYNK